MDIVILGEVNEDVFDYSSLQEIEKSMNIIRLLELVIILWYTI